MVGCDGGHRLTCASCVVASANSSVSLVLVVNGDDDILVRHHRGPVFISCVPLFCFVLFYFILLICSELFFL